LDEPSMAIPVPFAGELLDDETHEFQDALCPGLDEMDWFRFVATGTSYLAVEGIQDREDGRLEVSLLREDAGMPLYTSAAGDGPTEEDFAVIHRRVVGNAPATTYLVRVRRLSGLGGLPYRLRLGALPEG
jgi:hypothetical protein